MSANGAILWEGPSPHDGVPLAVIATGLDHASKNEKTGDMVQLWILRTDMAPQEAVRTGQDGSVCFACPMRSGGGCYVQVAKAPLSIWKAYRDGVYPRLDNAELIAALADRGRPIRFGAYGEPVAIPAEIVEALAGLAGRWTGYTHTWREARFQPFKAWLMASCDTEADRVAAKALGWRTFRVREANQPLLPGEIVCPASDEWEAQTGKRTDCAHCNLCSGTEGKAPSVDVAIVNHGARKKAGSRLRVVQ